MRLTQLEWREEEKCGNPEEWHLCELLDTA